MTDPSGRIAVFAPSPMLSVTIEARGEGRDDVHCHPAGQGVWLSRMAGELGAWPVLCSLIGGETGTVLEPLLERLPGERRLVRSHSSSGCYVTDRRSGEREVLAQAYVEPPSRHEADELVAATTAAAMESDLLAICNPYPGDAMPLDVYGNLVANARAAGVRVIADLSSPRLEPTAAAKPELVKLNDWELAAYVAGPVDTPQRLRAAAKKLRDLGARNVLVTRAGDPALALLGDEAWELIPPKLEAGSREGCGDTMMGAIAAALSWGSDLPEAMVLGAGAGAVNFLHHGLGTGSRREVEELAREVELRRA
ncbi:MAG: 1-phosphofructokinase family hexose kinase [Solirubrobacterales bacterium]|nr:PfkB family carbohydrate kinase [Solirubrobacterales bacterium]